jgi:hypothetical protein
VLIPEIWNELIPGLNWRVVCAVGAAVGLTSRELRQLAVYLNNRKTKTPLYFMDRRFPA